VAWTWLVETKGCYHVLLKGLCDVQRSPYGGPVDHYIHVRWFEENLVSRLCRPSSHTRVNGVCGSQDGD
jgi:hypothetical protein